MSNQFEAEKQEHGESAMKWDVSAPLVLTPHPAFARAIGAKLKEKNT